MKKILLGLAAVITGVMMTATVAMQPVWADESQNGGDISAEAGDDSGNSCGEGCIKTAILGEGGCLCDDGTGGGIVIHILSLVVDILTVGIGVLGVIGITVVGIQYLTAGGSEEKTRKAKQRMLEIVIGLIAYVLIYAILKWLLPTLS